QCFKSVQVVVATGMVADVRLRVLPELGLKIAAGKALDIGAAVRAKFLVGNLLPPVADQVKVLRQQVVQPEVVQGGDELALGQVSGGAKNHDHRGRRSAVLAQALKKGVTVLNTAVGHKKRLYKVN